MFLYGFAMRLPRRYRAGLSPLPPHMSRGVLRPPDGRARPEPCATWSIMFNVLNVPTCFATSGTSCRRPDLYATRYHYDSASSTHPNAPSGTAIRATRRSRSGIQRSPRSPAAVFIYSAPAASVRPGTEHQWTLMSCRYDRTARPHTRCPPRPHSDAPVHRTPKDASRRRVPPQSQAA